MFTIDQIKSAHANVKSGADYPRYVQDLIRLGVVHYDTFVADGKSTFFGENQFQAQSGARYAALKMADTCDPERFKRELRNHQQGQTDFLTFCKICAESGIEKWTADLKQMTCSYYDIAGNLVLVEEIPKR